jgi:hypothetical protein
MATQTRVYLVTPNRADCEQAPVQRRLIRTSHPSHALRHVAADEYSVAVASQDDLIALLSDGVPVETITHEQHELPET